MNITIEFHGVLRQLEGEKSAPLTLPDVASVADAIAALAEQFTALADRLPSTACAIGDTLVQRYEPLFEGAELVLVPPVSGG